MADGPSQPPTYMRRSEAAQYVGLRPQTLAKYASARRGPPFSKLGTRVIYAKSALDAWVAAHTVRPIGD